MRKKEIEKVKKILLVLIFLITSAQFAISDDLNVSAFFGGYTGYRHATVQYLVYDIDGEPLSKFNSIMFGKIIRFGLSYEISNDFSLYFLGLFDQGFGIDFSPKFSLSISLMLGGEIKAKYKNYFFGLCSGSSIIKWPISSRVTNTLGVFLMPSFGYIIKPNLLLEAFISLEDPFNNIRLGIAFSVFK